VQLLLDKGASVLARRRTGETPEDVASARGQEAVAAVLRAVAARRATWTAFAMGQHERLGEGSHLRGESKTKVVKRSTSQ